MTMRRMLCELAALLLASCAVVQPGDGIAIEILNCGVVDLLERTGRVAAPGTSLGYVNEVDALAIPRFTQSCPTLDIGVGDRMGLVVRVLGDAREASVPVTTRVTHPPITNPREGSPRVQDEWQWQLDTRYPRYTGWGFDQPWEVVGGTWQFEVIHAGRTIGTRTLLVRTRPASAP